MSNTIPIDLEQQSEPIRTTIRNNLNTFPTQSEQQPDVNRTLFRTIPDTIPMVPSKLFGFGRNTVRLQSERCTLWIGTPYAFASGRCTECPVIRIHTPSDHILEG